MGRREGRGQGKANRSTLTKSVGRASFHLPPTGNKVARYILGDCEGNYSHACLFSVEAISSRANQPNKLAVPLEDGACIFSRTKTFVTHNRTAVVPPYLLFPTAAPLSLPISPLSMRSVSGRTNSTNGRDTNATSATARFGSKKGYLQSIARK